MNKKNWETIPWDVKKILAEQGRVPWPKSASILRRPICLAKTTWSWLINFGHHYTMSCIFNQMIAIRRPVNGEVSFERCERCGKLTWSWNNGHRVPVWHDPEAHK